MEPHQIIVLADLLCQLGLREQTALAGEEEKNEVIKRLVQQLSYPLKQVLSSHQLEKQCGFEIISKLLNVADKETSRLIEAKFAGKLLCKTNEPEKIQLMKLDILSQLQRVTDSQKLLDELLF